MAILGKEVEISWRILEKFVISSHGVLGHPYACWMGTQPPGQASSDLELGRAVSCAHMLTLPACYYYTYDKKGNGKGIT